MLSLNYHCTFAPHVLFNKAFPNTSSFIYDALTRFYYDGVTGLLYEPNTRYFFDRVSRSYFFYDNTTSIYIPASQVAAPLAGTCAANKPEMPKAVVTDKVDKKAKKVVLEMSRWTKRTNSRVQKTTALLTESKSSLVRLLRYFSLKYKKSGLFLIEWKKCTPPVLA